MACQTWQAQVGTPCRGNSRLQFGVAVALAAPLLHLLGEEGGGFHFRGPSSIGKTTTLYVAGSVWGGDRTHGFVETWRVTANGLEAIASAHNDALLALDELSEAAPELGIGFLAAQQFSPRYSSRFGRCASASRFRTSHPATFFSRTLDAIC